MSTGKIPTKVEDAGVPTTASSNQSGSNDFVKKLFQMLQEDSYKDVVRWTTSGDSFVVINTTEFTKEILPRHFKHSNFASFVRQLNKYDFHKVKIPNEEKQSYQYGEDAWEFKHPSFRINDREALENIRRKGPTAKKNIQANFGSTGNIIDSHSLKQIRDEMDSMHQENKKLYHELLTLRTKYRTLIENIISLKSFDERMYRSMNILNNGLLQSGIKLPPLEIPNPHLISLQSSISPPNVRASAQIHQTTRPVIPESSAGTVAAPMAGMQTVPNYDPNYMASGQQVVQQGQMQPIVNPMVSHSHKVSSASIDVIKSKPQSPSGQANSSAQSPLISSSAVESLTGAINAMPAPTPSTSGSQMSPQATESLRIAEQSNLTTTNIPNPKFHVLLVEDDNVCIQLCRKFLVKYGCQVTVATDGLNAISTIEHTRYDLVLMDIVMPNLDGATATSVIRSFDTKTPIIAMTGNIEDNDLVTYLQNGMSDILAKPFTKDDLYSILSKHLLTNAENNHADAQTENGNLIADLQEDAHQTMVLPQEPQPLSTNPTSVEEHAMKRQKIN